MTIKEVMAQLKEMGNEQTAKVYRNHGVTGEFYGVKVGDLKKIVKKVKKDHALALALYETGNSDAMYLAGLVADEKAITKQELRQWAEDASWYMISEYTVAWLAADSPYGWELGLEWIESKNPIVVSAGWSTLSNCISTKEDEQLDQVKIEQLMERVENEIVEAIGRVKYTMNGFVLAVGSYMEALTDKAIQQGERMGKIKVNMGKTACKVPHIPTYIKKIQDKDRIGKKRKQARC